MTKKKEQPKTPEQLADKHWEWLEGVLLEEMRMKMILFKTAMVHGDKHGYQRAKEEFNGLRSKPATK